MLPFFVGGPPAGIPFTLNQASPQARGLMAWWPSLGNRHGAKLIDYSLYQRRDNYTGGTVDPTVIPTEERGLAWSFDGSNDQVSATSASIPSQFGALCAWVKPNLSGTDVDFFFAGTGGNDFRWLAGGSNNLWGFFIGAEYRISHAAPSNSVWTHVVLTWGTAGSVLYFNGVSKASNGSQPAAFNQTGLTIGGSSGGAAYYNGQMDDIRIYNRPLAASEVMAMYLPQTRWDLYAPLWSFVGKAPDVAGQPMALRQSQQLTGVRTWGRGF